MNGMLLALALACGAPSHAEPPHAIPRRDTNEPLAISIVIDVSASMLPLPPRWSGDNFLQGLDPSRVVDAIGALAGRLQPGERIRLVRMGVSLTFLTDFTADPGGLRTAARDIADVPDEERHGPSAIWDALVAVAESRPEAHVPHAILLVSDGRATGNRLRLDEAIARLRAAGVRVAIVMPPAAVEVPLAGGRAAVVDPALLLERIVDRTGGLLLRFNPADRFVFPLMDRAINHFRTATESSEPGVRGH